MTSELTFAVEWQQWHDQREARLRDPAGYLAITGLHWLGEQPRRFDDVPGSWAASDDGVRVELGESETLRVGEHVLSGTQMLGHVDEHGILAGWDDAFVEVAARFGATVLRPRHPDSPRLSGYDGTPTFDLDPSWRVAAAFEPYETPRAVEVGSVVEGRSSDIEALGEVLFTADGRPQRLIAFDGEDGGLWLLFTDESSGVTTYAAGRQLATAAPVDGTVVLDFNRTVNLPCAYTAYATCPLPPARNHIDVLVEAGEKAPLGG